jgi:hypothetical protein
MTIRRRPVLFAPLALMVLAAAVLFSCTQDAGSRTPSIALSPIAGGPSTWVTVTGEGFPSSITLNVRLGPPSVGATPQSYGQAMTDPQGKFTLTFSMPDQWPDGSAITEEELVVVIINEDGSVKATAPFCYQPGTTAQPGIALKPDIGAPGQQVVVMGHSFPASTQIALRLGIPGAGLSDSNLVTVKADDYGAFEVVLTIPTDWPGSGTPIVEQDLVIAAVDEAVGQTLATASLLNVIENLPTPTPPSGAALRDLWASLSPDGWWLAEGQALFPAEGADQYYTRLDVKKLDETVEWTVVDEWSPLALGYTIPAAVRWSSDGRYFYFTDRPVPDGCSMFVNG